MMVLLLLATCLMAAHTHGADATELPAELKKKLGIDPAASLHMVPVHSKEAADQVFVGAQREVAHELVAVHFASLGQGRSLWRLRFTEPWTDRGDVALIVYIDTDNDSTTGRQGGGVQGTDVMLRPDSVTNHGLPAKVLQTSAAHGNSLYLTLEAPINVENGGVAIRAYALVQHRQNAADFSRTPWFEVRAPASTAEPVAVAEDHPLFRVPEVIEQVAVHVPVEHDGRRAVVTWITSWPTLSVVEYGEPDKLDTRISDDKPAQNHRAVIDGLEPGRTYHCRVGARGGDGSPLSSSEVAFSTAVAIPVGSVAHQMLPLTISGAPGNARPVTGGLPFPLGALGSVQHMRLLDAAGNEVPLQARTTVRWPDNSVKWALLDLQVDIPEDGEARYALEFGHEVTRTHVADGIRIEQSEDAVVVDTGVLQVRFERNDFSFLGQVWLDANGDGAYSDGERVTDPTGAGIFLTDLDGSVYTSSGTPCELSVSRAGALSATVTARGRHRNESGEALFAWELSMQFYAGQPLVRLLHVFENNRIEQEEMFTNVRSLDLRLPLAGGQQGGRMFLPGNVGAALPAGAASRLLQSYDDRVRIEGFEAQADAGTQRARGAMGLQGHRGSITIAVQDFWQLYPKSLGTDARGAVVGILPALPAADYTDFDDEILFHRLWYYLEGGVYRFRLGMSKTHELLVRFHAGAVDDEQVRILAELSAARPLIVAPPAWYAQSKVFGDITSRTEGEFDEYETMVDRTLESFLREREQRREYGMLNFGDWWGERGYNWGNIEYDTQHGLFMQFARTGRREFFDNAVLAARHNTDVDIIHHARDPSHVGRPYAHCMYHVGNYFPRYNGPSATKHGNPDGGGHTWTRGNFEFAALTGDERAFRTALNTAQFLAGPLMAGFTMNKGAERVSAWQLYGVLAAYDFTADPYYLNAARIITREVVRQQNVQEGHWNVPAGYSQVRPLPIGGYAWCAGLLMTALEWANRHLQDPAIDETIVRAARWLARTEWIAGAKGFRSASCDTLTPAARPGSGSNRTPAAMLRAWELTGEEQFRDIAHTGFSYAVRASGAGKSGSTRLTLSPHTVHKLKAAGITSLDTSQWEDAVDVRTHGFVPVAPGRPFSLPVTLVSRRDRTLQLQVRIEDLPADWTPVEHRSIEIAPRASETISFDLPAVKGLTAGDTFALTVAVQPDGGKTVRQHVLLACPAKVPAGGGIGLVAEGLDFLGPALEQAGIETRRLEALKDLSSFAVIFLGTQAHFSNAAGLAMDYPLLLQWVHGGGTLLVSQLQDVRWRPEFLPGTVLLSNTSSESGAIAVPEHPVFAGISGVDALAGMTMYDSITEAEGWQVLLEDRDGGPAIITADFGAGRILAFMPSVERYVTGEATCSHPERLAAYGRLFNNILAWALAERN